MYEETEHFSNAFGIFFILMELFFHKWENTSG